MNQGHAALLDALSQKAARIERCLQRVHQEYSASSNFLTDFTRQDAAILNIQRACELALDMGNMVIAHENWGLPRSAREVFITLQSQGLIPAELATALQHMVGFRNIAVHEYEELDMAIVESVIHTELPCLSRAAAAILSKYLGKPE